MPDPGTGSGAATWDEMAERLLGSLAAKADCSRESRWRDQVAAGEAAQNPDSSPTGDESNGLNRGSPKAPKAPKAPKPAPTADIESADMMFRHSKASRR